MIKKIAALVLALLLTSALLGCMAEETPGTEPSADIPVPSSGGPSQSPPSPAKQLSEAIALACEKLEMNPVYVTYDMTDPETGEYVLEIAGLTYYLDPVSGDLKRDNGNLGTTLIINLYGYGPTPVDTDTDKSIEDVVTENIKNGTFDSSHALYSAKERVPYFVADHHEGSVGGLIIDNEYKSLDDLGIGSDDLTPFLNGGTTSYFVDVDNDGTAELCSDYLAGTGLFPNTEVLKLNESANGYVAYDFLGRLPNSYSYRWVQFFKCGGTVYTVVFFDSEYQIYEVTVDDVSLVSELRVTYPDYTVSAGGVGGVLSHLEQQYAGQLPYAYPGISANRVLTTADSTYSKLDKSIRDEYVGKSYTAADLNNDGSLEVFFQWVSSSQTKLGDTTYLNAYAVFKMTNGRYTLEATNVDTNLDESPSKQLPISLSDAGYPLNVFFSVYEDKTYTCIINKKSSADRPFETRNTEIVTVYLMERDTATEIGTLEIVYKPEITVNPETTNGTLTSLENKGFSISPAQSFWVELQGWGRVIFVSANDQTDGGNAIFYLANSGSQVIYTFPNFYGNSWTVYELVAVAFRDVNNDDLNDVIVIAECITGVGEIGAVPFTVADVYFQTSDGFERNRAQTEALNESGMNDSIKNVVSFFSDMAHTGT